MGFKENLKDEITYQGLMIKEVAALAGLTAGTMSNYLKENSSIPSADVAVKIAQALNVSVEYLVLGSNSKKTDNSSSYPPNIRKAADKMLLMSEKEFFLVTSLIDAILQNK